MPQSEVTSILDLIFTEKSGRIENLATGPPLGDLRRCHMSLCFDLVLNSPGYFITHSAKLNFKNANFEAIPCHFDFIYWDVLGPLNAENAYSQFFNKTCESFVS